MKIRSRRGAGIEMAMLLLLVVMGLSVLLTSTVTMQSAKIRRSEEKLEQRMVLEQVGRDFCVKCEGYSLPEELQQQGYSTSCMSEGSEKELIVYRLPETDSEDNPNPVPEPVLIIRLSPGDGYYQVTQWSYE